YCSLIKATKNVLNKIEVENRTITKITSKERKETRLWSAVALREAIINAFVHNDYTREVSPKFEIFSDRLEITSAGSLPEGLSKKEFFEGYSIPRNKELMRIYKDLDMVEQLGSGIPRILEHYGKDTFHFTENFLRMNFFASEQVTPQVTPQVLMFLKVFTGEHSRQELQDKMELSDRKNFRENYLQKAIEQNLIELTIPDKPRSSKQKYRLTQKGKMYQSK
ncbi:MAG TPA: ATP-binding protein, partial [Flavobacteriaceae bacterium]|nr:ATP-binding protein [Flavobacteriaceae bacterium]